MIADLLENLGDCPWNDSPVLVVLSAPTHRERLACSSLAVDHDCAVEALNHTSDDVPGAVFKNLLLRRVVKNPVELETPLLLLVVHVASSLVLRNLNCDVLI